MSEQARAARAAPGSPSARPPPPVPPPPHPLGRRRRLRRVLVVAASRSPPPAAQPSPTRQQPAKLVAGIPENDGVLGDPKAPITVTEYLDPQCPICAAASKATSPT